MKILRCLFCFWCLVWASGGQAQSTLTLTKTALADKIKGGWAGQVIGCTFGGPTEFRYQGGIIHDYQPIAWYDGYIKKTMENSPGLYDDVYMDLTFVQVFENQGIDAPASAHAQAYANAEYQLWHANQVGRNNVLNGLLPPASGHWLNNPQADAIDFQIEADFAGLMAPGMPNAASAVCDKIGHIMNYGDGWYGGVYMAAMYALAFTSTDVNYVVREGLKTIPAASKFHQCMADVIAWHQRYPNDWKATWFEVEKKYGADLTCPEGVFSSFNIDATINAAYVVMGLLYGQGDFAKTLEVSTRCGQDSDCNPASAGGILGTMLGYGQIPAYWKMGLAEAEDLDFKYTTMSLNEVYQAGLKQALQMVERNGGRVQGEQVTIARQTPQPVALEQGFVGHFPTEKRGLHQVLPPDFSADFEGVGYVLMGEARRKPGIAAEHDFRIEVYLDDKLLETVTLPTAHQRRRFNLLWKYQLPPGRYRLRIKTLNPSPDHEVHASHLVVYGPQPVTNAWKK